MTSITNAELAWNDAGTPVSDQFDDVYFSNTNGLEETRYVFLQQNHLPTRWESFTERRFTIGETGFGTGLNFLAVWQWFEQFRQQNPDAPLKELHFVSFEKFPLNKEDLIKAHLAWPELATYAQQLQQHYPIAVPECHRLVLADGMITLDLWFGDIKDCMPQVPTNHNGIIDAWFLDGFAPSKNPEMWNQTLFNNMAKLAKPNGTCATFTAAGFVRRGLIEAGFEMKKVKGFGIKREMIAGSLASDRVTRDNTKPWFARQSSATCDDIAIIGGGIASAALATALQKRHKNITVYCQDARPAEGASGNRQGAVYPLLNRSSTGVSRIFSPGLLFARQFFEQSACHIPFAHDWCGVTQLKYNDEASKKLDAIIDAKFHPQLITALDAQQTQAVVGVPVDYASVHYPLGGWLSPAQLTQGLLAQVAQQAHSQVHVEHKVTQLHWLDEEQMWQLTIQLSDGTQTQVKHQVVVIANGHNFDQFSQSADLPLSKVKGQVSHIPTTKTLQQLRSVICYDGYLTPMDKETQQHCIGASYDKHNLTTEFDAQAQIDNGEKLAHCIANQAWPKEVDTGDNQARQGIRCVSRDHLPFVGNIGQFERIIQDYAQLSQLALEEVSAVPSYAHLYCLLGLGSRGLSSAPLLAEVLASQICGDPLPLSVEALETLHPSRMWVRRLRKGKALTVNQGQ